MTTVFVYDVSGQLVAEYTTSGSSGGGTSYLTTDTLGTPRVITGSNLNDGYGGVKSRHDYLPFGEEVFVGRNSSYAGDTIRQKFTGYERDDETGLDYAQARHYSNLTGRFTSVDPLMASASIDTPQSWNRYAYVENNPLRYVDDEGRIKKDPTNQTGYKFNLTQATIVGMTSPISKIRYVVQAGTLELDNGQKILALYNIDQNTRGNANCHGLTFTGGDFNIQGPDVEKILVGDSYVRRDDPNKPTTPQVGDVAIYREYGAIVHSATVTSVDENGNVAQVAGIDIDDPNILNSAPDAQGRFSGITPTYYYQSNDSRTPEQRQADAQNIANYQRPSMPNAPIMPNPPRPAQRPN